MADVFTVGGSASSRLDAQANAQPARRDNVDNRPPVDDDNRQAAEIREVRPEQRVNEVPETNDINRSATLDEIPSPADDAQQQDRAAERQTAEAPVERAVADVEQQLQRAAVESAPRDNTPQQNAVREDDVDSEPRSSAPDTPTVTARTAETPQAETTTAVAAQDAPADDDFAADQAADQSQTGAVRGQEPEVSAEQSLGLTVDTRA